MFFFARLETPPKPSPGEFIFFEGNRVTLQRAHFAASTVCVVDVHNLPRLSVCVVLKSVGGRRGSSTGVCNDESSCRLRPERDRPGGPVVSSGDHDSGD